MMNMGKRIKHVRKRLQLSLVEVHEALLNAAKPYDIRPQTLGRYEQGKRTPDLEFLEALGRHFNVSAAWLLYGQTPVFQSTSTHKNPKESFLELSNLLEKEKITPSPQNPLTSSPLAQITDDTPENFNLMLTYMLQDAQIRCLMFQWFHFNLKPQLDARVTCKTHSKIKGT